MWILGQIYRLDSKFGMYTFFPRKIYTFSHTHTHISIDHTVIYEREYTVIDYCYKKQAPGRDFYLFVVVTAANAPSQETDEVNNNDTISFSNYCHHRQQAIRNNNEAIIPSLLFGDFLVSFRRCLRGNGNSQC